MLLGSLVLMFAAGTPAETPKSDPGPPLVELLFVFGGAGIVVYLFQKLGLPSVVGLLAAGVLIGPTSLGLVTDTEQVHLLAEVGIVVLLFAVGLEFSLSRMLAMARTMMLVGLPQVAFCIAATVAVTWGGVQERQPRRVRRDAGGDVEYGGGHQAARRPRRVERPARPGVGRRPAVPGLARGRVRPGGPAPRPRRRPGRVAGRHPVDRPRGGRRHPPGRAVRPPAPPVPSGEDAEPGTLPDRHFRRLHRHGDAHLRGRAVAGARGVPGRADPVRVRVRAPDAGRSAAVPRHARQPVLHLGRDVARCRLPGRRTCSRSSGWSAGCWRSSSWPSRSRRPCSATSSARRC